MGLIKIWNQATGKLVGEYKTCKGAEKAADREDAKYGFQVCFAAYHFALPTDDDSIRKELASIGVQDIDKWLPYEKCVRELENEGLTRSDAQGVADVKFPHLFQL